MHTPLRDVDTAEEVFPEEGKDMQMGTNTLVMLRWERNIHVPNASVYTYMMQAHK